MRLKLLLAVVVIVVIAVLYLFNPVEHQLLPSCVFHRLTGLSCPGCGMQRFFHALLHGHLTEAVGYNVYLVLLIPYVAAFALERLLLTGRRGAALRRIVEGRTATTLLAASVPAWMLLRNLVGI